MASLAMKARLSARAAILDKIGQHREECARHGIPCAYGESIQNKILAEELRDILICTKMDEVDKEIEGIITPVVRPVPGQPSPLRYPPGA